MSPGVTPGHRVKAAERGGSEIRDEDGREGAMEGATGLLTPSRCHTASDTLILSFTHALTDTHTSSVL